MTGAEASSTRELLARVGMGGAGEHRSDPLADPAAFHELATRLGAMVDVDYDVIVVRDLFGDRVLGYELALAASKPLVVSADQEGVVVLRGAGSHPRGCPALLVADTHFSAGSIQATAMQVVNTGFTVAGLAMLVRTVDLDHPWPVWILEEKDDPGQDRPLDARN